MSCFRGALVAAETRPEGEPPAAERAAAAAAEARARWATSVGLAAVAGPRAANAGSVAVALAAVIDDARHTTTVILPGDRHRYRDFAVINLLDHLRKVLAA